MKRTELRRKAPLRRKHGLKRSRAQTKAQRSKAVTGPQDGAEITCIDCGVPPERWLVYGRCPTCDTRARRKWNLALKGATCAKCGSTKQLQLHHVCSKSKLKQIGRLDVIWDAANALPLCADPAPNRCHDRHTAAFDRVPYECLPREAIAFAEEVGLTHLLDRYYPKGEDT